MRLTLIAGVALILGCGGSEGETSESGETGSTAEVDCYTLDVEECGETEACHVITAQAVQYEGGEPCVDYSSPREEKGCMPNDVDCGDAITFAAPADDPADCWMFRNTCTPTGWGPCESIQDAGDCPE